MFSTLFSAAALSLLAARGALADFSVSATNFVQCGSAHLTWNGTNQAVNIILVPADDPCDTVLYDLGDHSKDSMSWNVTLPAGTELLISAEDAAGEEAWSNTITVGTSSDSSCLSASQLAAVASSAVSVATSVVALAPSASAVANPGSTSDGASSSAGLLGAANAGVGPTESSAAPRALAPLAFAGSALAVLFSIL